MDYLQNMCLLVYTLILVSRISLALDELFYPYGDSIDQKLPREDDIGVEVNLARHFPYFDSNHRSLFVNDNGILSFLKLVKQYEPDSFPLGDNRRIIAPYWADVDLSKGNGYVYYREVTNDQELFERATAEVLRVFGGDLGLKQFTTKWLFIATWKDVPFFRVSGMDQQFNTFQTVLITDGLLSFVVFNYGDLEWTTGWSSFGEDGLAKGNNSIAAQVGFNAGDGATYYVVEGSRTNKILEINETSNIGRAGRWMFRVDFTDIQPGGCYDDIQTLSISPKVASMMGGDVLYVSGPCFDDTKVIRCLIDGIEIPTAYDRDSPFTVTCVTPTTLKVGDMTVSLSVDGGNSYPHTGSIYLLSIDQLIPPIYVSISGDNLDISWPVVEFPYLDSNPTDTVVELSLYAYQEQNSVRRTIADDIKLEKIITIDRNFPLSRGSYTVYLPSLPVKGRDVGLLHIEEYLGTSSTELKPSMWSLPFNLNPLSSDSASSWCSDWADTADVLDSSDDIHPCPCILSQALVDSTWYDADPFCRIDSQLEYNCAGRPSAVHCVRVRLPSSNGHGNRCCYSSDGYIIHLEDNLSGGSHQLYHHSGVSPYQQLGQIPFLSNFLWDTIPWSQCCGRSNGESCEKYLKKRPSDQCLDYNTPEPASIFGEPHIITFDDASFVFNEGGEYQLMRSDSMSEFEIQGRLQPLNISAFEAESIGTSLTTFVIKYPETSQFVQVVLSERRTMDLMTWEEGQMTEWQLIDFSAGPFWRLNGITVSSTIPSTILIQYDNGLSVQVSVHTNSTAMALLVLAPETFKGTTTGLLGSWNDDPSDDNKTSNEFLIQPSNSYFHPDAVDNYLTFNQLVNVSKSTVSDEEVAELCKESATCAYDYHKTGDSNIAEGTKDAEDEYNDVNEGTTDVSVCPRLDAPEGGSKSGTMYLSGKTVTFTCPEGLILTGSDVRICINGSWSGNLTSCDNPEAEPVSSTNIIFPLVIAAVALFVIIFIILLIMYCRIKRGKKHKEVIEMDPTHERVTSNIDPGFNDIETPEEDVPNAMVVPIYTNVDPEFSMLDDNKKKGIDNDYMSVRNGRKPAQSFDDDELDEKKSAANYDDSAEPEDEIDIIKNNFKAEDQLS